jgi:hypothetical protein
MKKLSILLIALALIISRPVFAEEMVATQSAEEINENLKQRIQDVVKDKLDTAEENIKDKQERGALVGYSGIITKIMSSVIIINTSQNTEIQITTNENTDVVRNGQVVKLTSLSIEEKIITIGQLDTEDILSAKRIVAIKTTTPDSTRQTVVGPIQNLDLDTLELTIGDLTIDIPKNLDLDTEEIEIGQTIMAIIETDIEDQTHTLLSLQLLLQ